MKSIAALLVLISLSAPMINAQDSVWIDINKQFQTIEGWGHGGSIFGHVNGIYYTFDSAIADPVNYQIIDYLTDELGLTGSRTWETGPRIDGTGMDNGDCDNIDWSKFQSDFLPPGLAKYLVYFKNKIIAKGYKPNFYSSPTYPTFATALKPWVLYNPGERAQQIWANALFMKNTYGIDIDYDVIYNEPSGVITTNILTDDIKALGPRLILHGLNTMTQYAEAVAPQTNWDFINPIQNDTSLWKYVGRISYHNYGTADPYRSYMRDFANTLDITTAQTEMANPTFDDLYNDLTLGGVSYWEVAFSSGNTLQTLPGLTSFNPSSTFFRLRQLIHYVHPGDIRIQSISNDSMLHVIAFINKNELTTIIENLSNAPRSVLVKGIPKETYAISQSLPGAGVSQELGIRKVLLDDTLNIKANGNSTVTTIYPYDGINHPPSLLSWKSNPGYLVLPAASATLTASANDSELDALNYKWYAVSFPNGANPKLLTPNAATTIVNELNIAGTYVFKIEVNDGTHTVSRLLYLIVYDSNPQPMMGSAGFRIAAPYGLVFDKPGSVTHSNIELPISSVILQVGIGDLANSDFTGRGKWQLIQQPAGANAKVDSTIYIYVSIRANASNMTVPGDYVFQCNVTNPGHPDLIANIICTVHPQSSAPVIINITADPPNLNLPMNSIQLHSNTMDPEGDLLRHWWAIKSAPVGVNPLFDHQCLPITNVSGLNIAGKYTFTLRAFDDLHMSTKDISVVVGNPTETESDTKIDHVLKIYPNPFHEHTTFEIVSLPEINDAYIEISNLLGKEVLSRHFQNKNKISISNHQLHNGIYFYKLIYEGKIKTSGKLIVD